MSLTTSADVEGSMEINRAQRIAMEKMLLRAQSLETTGILAVDPEKYMAVDGYDIKWSFYVQGPAETMWAKGAFQIFVTLPEAYPLVPPSVKFAAPVYHPNIGLVDVGHDPNIFAPYRVLQAKPAIDILEDRNWCPETDTVGRVLARLRAMLGQPDLKRVLNMSAAQEYVQHQNHMMDKKENVCCTDGHDDEEEVLDPEAHLRLPVRTRYEQQVRETVFRYGIHMDATSSREESATASITEELASLLSWVRSTFDLSQVPVLSCCHPTTGANKSTLDEDATNSLECFVTKKTHDKNTKKYFGPDGSNTDHTPVHIEDEDLAYYWSKFGAASSGASTTSVPTSENEDGAIAAAGTDSEW